MTDKSKNNLHDFIDVSHIYKTKPESWFKFLGLAVAWFGGFFWLAPSIDITQYSVAFFVYSIALFMEYFFKLTSPTRLPRKIYPLSIVLCGILILLDSISQWRNQGMGFLPMDALNLLAFLPVVILFVDTLSITMIEKNERTAYKPENNLLKGKR